MTINVKISLCKITRSSKLFQRNYYLPLLKPLSPKDALRRKVITGQNILGSRIEHYIPCLESHEERVARRKRRPKGMPVIKKRVRVSERLRYVTPFLDDDMDGHLRMQGIIARKGRGKGQSYCYEIIDKGCCLVLPFQWERAIRDKDIIDVVIAQRSEKIVAKLKDGTKISVPLASYDGRGPLYRGSGWTKELVEEEHHHGKETFSIAKIFEAKESGVEEWELEMMRLANKRKKKIVGEDKADWKEMLAGCLENMDWDKFEEDTKQIVEEKDEIVEEEDIPMEVDDMEKTKNVAEKLKAAGEEVLKQLPTMIEVPEVIKVLETGEMTELVNVSGINVTLSKGQNRFIVGQMVKGEENEVFVPGQTIISEEGVQEYTPGITVLLDGEPSLIPGLVMGEDETPAIFLPGESTITEGGQLQFEATEDDLPPREPSPSPESSLSSSSRSPSPEPTPIKKIIKKPQEVVIKRRVIEEPTEPVKKKKERVKKRPPVGIPKEKTPPKVVFRPQRQPLEDPMFIMEQKRRLEDEEERKRLKQKQEEKSREEEMKVDKLRFQLRQKYKNWKVEAPGPYQPLDPVQKSKNLQEMEESISKGTFFEDEKIKNIMANVRGVAKSAKYRNAFVNSYGYGTITSGFLGLNHTYRVH